MKTKNLFNTCPGFAVLAFVFCLNGCWEDVQYPGEPVPDGLAVRSVRFYFTDASNGRLESVYEFCDNDGCCDTPAEKVDTFRLMSDHRYVCSLKLNGENPNQFLAGRGESAWEYSFSYNPDNVLDLIINWPDMEDNNFIDLRSDWTTGQPGNGFVNFIMRYCPYNFVQGQCYEILLPVAIGSPGDID